MPTIITVQLLHGVCYAFFFATVYIFVDAAFPKDTGFALKGWAKCDVANAAIFIAGDSATTMGNVNITGKDGKVTTVDKTWKFVKDDAGKLRIVVHHSSLPYSGS